MVVNILLSGITAFAALGFCTLGLLSFLRSVGLIGLGQPREGIRASVQTSAAFGLASCLMGDLAFAALAVVFVEIAAQALPFLGDGE